MLYRVVAGDSLRQDRGHGGAHRRQVLARATSCRVRTSRSAPLSTSLIPGEGHPRLTAQLRRPRSPDRRERRDRHEARQRGDRLLVARGNHVNRRARAAERAPCASGQKVACGAPRPPSSLSVGYVRIAVCRGEGLLERKLRPREAAADVTPGVAPRRTMLRVCRAAGWKARVRVRVVEPRRDLRLLATERGSRRWAKAHDRIADRTR